ncbi:hypothetical protein GIB67_009408 [Kingdonia uniflora]|uniref:DUF4408 domain-containing protein n=1 Tax=Kingdonia uniflora TaxID=39325 RepID=A0A7J7N2V8_9MAGN|nr:hypothetical protein GIB67_009408 [Kingdonia uniflora]
MSTIEKQQALNKYKRNQFLNNLIIYSFTALTCSIFCYNSLWFSSFCSSLEAFLFVYLPNIGILLFSPKCLFVVCNIIVVFLVVESKFGGSRPSPATEIYEEYVKRSASFKKLPSTPLEKNEEVVKLDLCLVEESIKKVIIEKGKREGKDQEEEDTNDDDGEEKNEKDENLDAGNEDIGFPTEELNQKVEDFIARINRQRILEARLLCSS